MFNRDYAIERCCQIRMPHPNGESRRS
jgi:hypothetical protein